MIDEKEILAARDSIAGLTAAPIVELTVGDWVLVPWGVRVLTCQIQQVNMSQDRFGPHWVVNVRVDDGGTRGAMTFYLPPHFWVVVVKGADR